jgi:hypothetical protein
VISSERIPQLVADDLLEGFSGAWQVCEHASGEVTHHQVGSTGGGHTLHPPILPNHQERDVSSERIPQLVVEPLLEGFSGAGQVCQHSSGEVTPHQVGSTGVGHTLHPPILPIHQERVSLTLLHQEIHLDSFQEVGIPRCQTEYTMSNSAGGHFRRGARVPRPPPPGGGRGGGPKGIGWRALGGERHRL